jgi:pimeloyl-ACP methyl ester carboxylesterase
MTMTQAAKTSVQGSDDTLSRLGELKYTTVDGLRIRYATGGLAKGNPIVLLSPWPESIYAFLPTWDVFASMGPVTAIDLPGFGCSQSRPEVVAPEPMGDFIYRAIQAFEIDRPHIVGPDIGTPALLYAAANYPGLFKSMIVGGGATDPGDIGDLLEVMVNAPSLAPFENMTGAEFVQGVVDNLKNYTLPDLVMRDYVQSYAGARFLESVAFVRNYPKALPKITARLSEIDTPVQIIVGRHDPYVPVSNAELLRKGLPKSKLDILDCGHFAWEDGAAEYGRIAAQWIQGGYARV